MKRSTKPWEELTKANTALSRMRGAASLDDFEQSWCELLRHLERVWSKACAHFGRSPKWGKWKQDYVALREEDPLLSYLVAARGADEHTVDEITERSKPSVGIGPAEGNTLRINTLEVRNGRISIDSLDRVRVTFLPGKTFLRPIKYRKGMIPVPSTHLGEPVDATDIVRLAEIAIGFYEDFLRKTESEFVK